MRGIGKWGKIGWGIALSGLLVGWFICNCSMGSVAELAREVDAHLFFTKYKGDNAYVVNVVSRSKVEVVLPNKENREVRYDRISSAEKKLPPVGRVTICETEGTSQYQTHVSSDFIQTLGDTHFRFCFVVDRPIQDCYVVLMYTFPDQTLEKGIAFAKIGDLEPGKLLKEDIIFNGVILPDGTSYNFEFYSKGFPLETFYLPQVVGNPRSGSLFIPWKVRLEQYLVIAEKKKLTRQPVPIDRGFFTFDIPAIKDRGIKALKLAVLVKKDGSVEMLQPDPQLTPAEQGTLASDLLTWRFLPRVKDGLPQEANVSFPIRF